MEGKFSTTESLYGKNSRTETDQSFYLELYSIVVGWICPSGRAIAAIFPTDRQPTNTDLADMLLLCYNSICVNVWLIDVSD